MNRKLEFERRSRREILQTPVFRLNEEISVHPETGTEGTYYVLDAPDWVNILEETGFVPKTARLRGEIRPNCAIQSNRCFTVLDGEGRVRWPE